MTNTGTQTRLLELAERLEVATSQALSRLEGLRPIRGSYSETAYSTLRDRLTYLQDACEQVRYSAERDRSMLS